MALKITYTHTFVGLSSPVPLSYLDDNYADVETVVSSLNTYSNYLQDTGAVNTYAVSLAAGESASVAAGLSIQVKIANTNTGASTISIDAGPAKSIKNQNGSALIADQLMSGGVYSLQFDGTNFQLVGAPVALLTSGRMPRAITGGVLVDDANSPTCDASGNVLVKGTLGVTGPISTTGPSGGVVVCRRATAATAWELYSTAGNLQIFNGALDQIVVASGTTPNVTIGTKTNGDNAWVLNMLASNAVKNWQISFNSIGNGISFIPSTAGGGSTFTTSAFSIRDNGDVDMVTSGCTLTVGVGANNGTVSAGVFTDRTKHFEGDAIAAIRSISGKGGEIDHSTLPEFAQARTPSGDIERDLGATVSLLLVGFQQLLSEFDAYKVAHP